MAAQKESKPAAPPPKKRDDDPCEEGLPGWMATFADMVSLLLCFFILLLSFANQDITKFKTLMGSIKDAFGVQVKRKGEFAALSPSQYSRKEVALDQDNNMILGMVLELKTLVLDNEELKKTADVSQDSNGAVMRVPDSVLFEPDSAVLKPSAGPVFKAVIKMLKEHTFDLVVRGHTNNQFTETGKYPTNWELSAARATAALRYIMKHGDIPASRLKAVGYADSQPLFPNNTETNRRLNARMEFYFHLPEIKGW